MKKVTSIFTILCVFMVLLSTAHAAQKEYIIGKGDSLSIRVWGEGELSTEAMVRPDGKISLPGIGEMQAAGVTPRQLQARITAALRELVFEPLVSVSVNTFPANSIIVYGPGTVPAVIPLHGKTTLLQVLSSIRLDHNSDLVGAYLERDGQKIASNFQMLLKEGKDNQANMELLASDRLFVPKSEARFVYVDGAVNGPKSIPYTDKMTILEAIHLAGGFTKFADRNATIITRQGNGGTQRLTVRMADLISNGDMSQNVTLQGGDLIVVETSWF